MTLRDELRQHLIGTTTGYDEDRVEAIVDLALGLHDARTQHRVGITQVGLQSLEEPRENLRVPAADAAARTVPHQRRPRGANSPGHPAMTREETKAHFIAQLTAYNWPADKAEKIVGGALAAHDIINNARQDAASALVESFSGRRPEVSPPRRACCSLIEGRRIERQCEEIEALIPEPTP